MTIRVMREKYKSREVAHTLDDLMAVAKFSSTAATHSSGAETAESTYRTAELYSWRSGWSLSSDMRKISGLDESQVDSGDEKMKPYIIEMT
jgi:hypothetical protein